MGARAQGAGGEVADPPGAGAEVASDRGATGANEPGVGGEATDPGPTPPTAPRRERASKEAPGPRLPVTAARRERTSQARGSSLYRVCRVANPQCKLRHVIKICCI
jgi:hypothetical protein